MKKILVANRGEIALRVMKTAREMGIKTVAVYSEADRHSPHVRYADEAILLGPPPSSESYLLGEVIIEKAKALNVDAIHPGYGFLSENAGFAKKVKESGIVWIGPDTHAIEVMGSKLAAKEAVKSYDIPMVPGIDEAIEDVDKATSIAKEIGFPILIKASAGGGGKGMRVVEKETELESQMKRAISEAKSAFGDGSVFIEKYIASPRHIEIQVLADKHGNTVHLFERECSIQRRHQKVVEEAPSSVLSETLRENMGAAAVRVAKACDYVGAGTVEFLIDDDHNFYFLEMNTRLQVEHPVTELITGIDLVEQQIKVANGETLSFTQEDLKIDGHAVELRVYAEDPLNDFLPSVGNLEVYKLPEGNGIRVDNGFEEGMEVPIYYDPMLAKLITYGKTREAAIQLMVEAIDAYEVEGIQTTLPFGKFVFENDAFRSGNFNTHFVKNNYSPEKLKAQFTEEAELAAKVALRQYLKDSKQLRLPKS
ncbi:acetyl-CoA carboxylase biotin carboxylase subunit [Croceibacter atlanticus]|jgi:acetyl-CoA carboxylase biotin carboxylase subunit|uniref:acetyl-CoA carboxylase biotin carboxylase subunit n=1 Tax=Croceibacter atlanticus TaxID=313588 RepID=UPI0024BACACD|nr:acetyl-CoA carboxylase biotin carboxylase subunit [Croceibacter atlanticus]